MGLTVNGVDLSYCATEQVSQVPQYDDSGVDMLYNLVTISVRAVINQDLSPAGGAAPGDTIAALRDTLMNPRRSCVYVAGDGTVLDLSRPVLPGGGVTDDAWGPKVLGLSFSQPTPATIVVTYTIEARVIDCSAPGALKLLSLRWTDTHDIDGNGFSTRTRSGTLVTGARGPLHPDDYSLRLQITPAPTPGFRRERAHYQLDPTGLKVAFEFVDRQMARTAPYSTGATKMSGRQVETIDRQTQKRTGTVSVRLEGHPPNIPQQAAGLLLGTKAVLRSLLNACVALAMSRIEASGPFRTRDNKILLGGEVAESLDDDKLVVEFTATWMIRPEKNRTTASGFGALAAGAAERGLAGATGVAIDTGWVGATPAGTFNTVATPGAGGALSFNFLPWAIAPPPRGYPTASAYGTTPSTQALGFIGLFAGVLRDPCGRQVTDARTHSVGTNTPAWVNFPDPATTGSGRLTVNVAPVPDTPGTTDQKAVYADADPGVYEYYTAEIEYERREGKLVLPTTAPGGKNLAVKFAEPGMRATVYWLAVKAGEPPEAPRPATDNANAVLTYGKTLARNTTLAADGVTPIYHVGGVFEYSFLDPAAVQMNAPGTPYLDLRYSDKNRQVVWSNIGESPLDVPDTGRVAGVITNPFGVGPDPGGQQSPGVVGA